MKLATLIKRLESKRKAYIKKHGHEPVIWNLESDVHECELVLDMVNGIKGWLGGQAATSENETHYIKWGSK